MIEGLIIVGILAALGIYNAVRRAKRSDNQKPEDIYPLW
jgi:hypothetical protein